MDTKIEIKQEPFWLETESVIRISESGMIHGPDVHIKNEPAFLSSDDKFQSEGEIQRQTSEMDMKSEIKEEPISLETTSTEVKFESGVIHGPDVHINNEPAFVSSADEFQSDYQIYEDDNEIETKEEPLYPELKKSEVKKISGKDMDLYFNTEDKASEQCQKLTDSSRLVTEAVWNCETGINCAGLQTNWLKPRENSSPSHQKYNTITAAGGNTTKTFNVDKTLYKCKFCGKCFNLVSSLQNHIVIHHGKTVYKRGNKITKPLHLGKPNLILKGKKRFKCDKCDKSYFTPLLLRAHNLFHEENNKCFHCGETFSKASDLETHSLAHNIQKLYNCDKCDKSFTSLFNLKTHTKSHEIQKSFKCSRCAESFTGALDLKAHKLIHKDEGPLRCDYCRKIFTKLLALKHHKLAHEGKSPHKCEHCKKHFPKAASLKSHLLTHNSEKPYKCDLCEKSYSRETRLHAHILSHEDKRHKCDVCERRFTTASHLKDHVLIHEGKLLKHHKCDICDRICSSALNLKSHISSHKGKRVTTTEKVLSEHILKSTTE